MQRPFRQIPIRTGPFSSVVATSCRITRSDAERMKRTVWLTNVLDVNSPRAEQVL